MLAVVSICGIVFSLYHYLWIIIFLVGIIIYAQYNLLTKKKYIKAVIWGSILIIAFMVCEVNCTVKDNERVQYLSKLTDGESVYVFGRIYKSEYKNNSYSYYLKSNSGFKVLIYSDNDILSVGDCSTIKGKVYKFSSATNEGEFNQKEFYYSQMILFRLDPEKIVKLDKRIFNFEKAIYVFKNELTNSLKKISDGEELGALCTMLLGEKSLLSYDMKESYQDAGISHILAISGLHISLVGIGIYGFMRKRRAGFVCAMIVAGGIAYIYYFMSGCAISTERALFMFFLTMIAQTIGRSNDMLNSLGISILIIVYENPFIIKYPGFVFSVVAVMGVALIVRDISGNKIKVAILSSVAMQLATIPVVAIYYYEIPAYSVIINIIVLPLISIVFISGLSAAFIGLISAPIASIVIIPAIVVLKLYTFLCNIAQGLMFNKIIVGCPGAEKIVVYYVILFMLIFVCKKYKSIVIRMFGISVLLSIIFVRGHTDGEIDFLDVGQGDAIFVQIESGESVFIDGGSSSKKKVGENIILPFLKYNGVHKIDYWFISHADEDHVNGLTEVLESNYCIENVVISKASKCDENMQKIISLSQEKGINVIEISAGDTFRFANTQITCIAPGEGGRSDNRNNSDSRSNSEQFDANDSSLVLLVDDKKNNLRCMLAGDISSEVENSLVKKYGNKIDIDIYKANHHGSKYSSSKEWLNALSPDISVISCGENNRYGHPHEETLERFGEIDSKVFRTDENGQIRILLEAVSGILN